jgi:hypothetical protein
MKRADYTQALTRNAESAAEPGWFSVASCEDMPAMRIEYGDDPYSVTYEDEDDFEDFEPEYEDERDQIDRRDSDG